MNTYIMPSSELPKAEQRKIYLDRFRAAADILARSHGVSPEVFGRGLKDMAPEQGARLGLETTRAVMQKAGVA